MLSLSTAAKEAYFASTGQTYPDYFLIDPELLDAATRAKFARLTEMPEEGFMKAVVDLRGLVYGAELGRVPTPAQLLGIAQAYSDYKLSITPRPGGPLTLGQLLHFCHKGDSASKVYVKAGDFSSVATQVSIAPDGSFLIS